MAGQYQAVALFLRKRELPQHATEQPSLMVPAPPSTLRHPQRRSRTEAGKLQSPARLRSCETATQRVLPLRRRSRCGWPALQGFLNPLRMKAGHSGFFQFKAELDSIEQLLVETSEISLCSGFSLLIEVIRDVLQRIGCHILWNHIGTGWIVKI